MSTATIERPSRTRAIPVRRLEVDLANAEYPRWLVDDDPVLSHFIATLSAVFPRGEEFFVTTVRQHRHAAADDPVLKAQVKAFAGQEAMHGREHRALNACLDALGYRTAAGERGIGRVLDLILAMRPARLPIAVTAAAEHLTGVLAEAALGHDGTRATLFGHPTIETLIAWHALEELEHKNVAFDVLEASGGGYGVRMAGAGVAVTMLGGYVVAATARGILGDARSLRPRHARNLVRDLRRQRLLSPWALRQALRYLRPGFHPDDMHTDELVEEWRVRLADDTTITAGMRG